MQQTTRSSLTATPSNSMAIWSIAFSTATLALLVALHIVSPEFAPSWRMVSEYALGDYGWLLSLLFVCWALCNVTLFFAVQAHVQTLRGKIGLGFLLVSALGMSLAAVFDVSHSLHGMTALIGLPTLPIAALLISVSLLRDPAWSSARPLLLWTANLTWISLIFMVAVVMIGLPRNGGELGPNVLVGWPNRLVITAYCGWVMATAWSVLRFQIPLRIPRV